MNTLAAMCKIRGGNFCMNLSRICKRQIALQLSPGIVMAEMMRNDEAVGDGSDGLLDLSPLWEGRREDDGMDEMGRAKNEE